MSGHIRSSLSFPTAGYAAARPQNLCCLLPEVESWLPLLFQVANSSLLRDPWPGCSLRVQLSYNSSSHKNFLLRIRRRIMLLIGNNNDNNSHNK